MSESEQFIDLRPSKAYQGTAMIPEGDYDIADAKFGMWDYNGKQPTPVPALCIDFKEGDTSFMQWYSAGDAKNLRPSEDGKRLVQQGTATSLNNQTNCFQFLTSLVRAKFDEERIMHDISSLVGLRVHVVHEPTAERDIKGVKKSAGTMAVIGQILSDPAKDGKGKPAAKPAAAPAAGGKKANGQEVPTTTPELAKKTTTYVVQALKEAPNSTLDRKSLSTAVFRKIPGTEADRHLMLNLLIQDSYLLGLVDDGVLYDPGNAQASYIGG